MNEITDGGVDLHRVRLQLALGTLQSFGELRFEALGYSMFPSIFPEDTVLVRRRAIESFIPGHIALF